MNLEPFIELGLHGSALKSIQEREGELHGLARVSAVQRDRYEVLTPNGMFQAELSGRMLHQADTPLDFPTVGDWVDCLIFDEETTAVIQALFARNSVLQRKVSGKRTEIQLIAANLDVAFLVQAMDGDFSLRRLERYLAMAYQANVIPHILFSKIDLIDESTLQERIESVQNLNPGLMITGFSNLEQDGPSQIETVMQPGRTYGLFGSSGVGKTTLINALIQENRYATSAVREHDSRGRHTTTYRQLIPLPSGAFMIDTPGMRELSHIAAGDAVQDTFQEISELEGSCRFGDCTHQNEKGCAIREAIAEGRISEDRLQSYIKLQKENAFHERSYHEKRQHDRKLGKLYRSIKKEKYDERHGGSKR